MLPALLGPGGSGEVTAAVLRVTAADLYLFSVPVWGHDVPDVLSRFLDVVNRPGPVSDLGSPTGPLAGKRAVVLFTAAVAGEGRPPQFAAGYRASCFRAGLCRAGVETVDTVEDLPDVTDPPGMRGTAPTRAGGLVTRPG